jgi:hypothetical protein
MVYSPVYDWDRNEYYFQGALTKVVIFNSLTNEVLAEIKYLR